LKSTSSALFATSTTTWKNAVVREALTFDSIREMPPEEAAALFVTRHSEGLTESEASLLAGWLTSDEAHRRALDGAERAWNSLEGSEDDDIVAAMLARALAPPRRVPISWGRLAAAAAIVLVIAGAASLVAPGLKPHTSGAGGQPAIASAAVTYVSAVGKVTDIVLPDGSRMTLDADSTAVGRFGAGGRSVDLTRGRAFFAVVHDASKPFTVHAGDRRLVDVGTRFDVNLGAQALTVTLLDGRLAIGPAGQTSVTTTLEPGQQLVHARGQDEIRTVGAGADDATAWRTGLITFDNQPLAEAAAVMNRYSHDQIVIRDPAVAAIRVTGQFHAGRSDGFAETLTELYGLRARRQAGQIELLPRG
jgi:transmembrane sensor